MNHEGKAILTMDMEEIIERAHNVFLNLPKEGGDRLPEDISSFFFDRCRRVEQSLEEICEYDMEASGGGDSWLFVKRSLDQVKMNFINIIKEISEDGFQMKEAELFAHSALWLVHKAKEILQEEISGTEIRVLSSEDIYIYAASSLNLKAMEALCIAESACLKRFDVKDLFCLTEVRDSEERERIKVEWEKHYGALKQQRINRLKEKDLEPARREAFSMFLESVRRNPGTNPARVTKEIQDDFLAKQVSIDAGLPKHEYSGDIKSKTLYSWIQWYHANLADWIEYADDDSINFAEWLDSDGDDKPYIDLKKDFMNYVASNFSLYRKNKS